jgi:hypothetical protein
MRKLLPYLLVCLLSLFSYSSICLADDDTGLIVDEDGQVHTDDGKAERTFSFPPVKTGFLLDVYSVDIQLHLSLEVYSFGDFTVDVGAASSRSFVSLTWEFIPVIKIGASLWGGYNVVDNSPAFGIGASILEF